MIDDECGCTIVIVLLVRFFHALNFSFYSRFLFYVHVCIKQIFVRVVGAVALKLEYILLDSYLTRFHLLFLSFKKEITSVKKILGT